MQDPELTVYGRKLPHWRIEGAIYFVTWRLAKQQPLLTPGERTIVTAAIRLFDGERYQLLAWVVMDDHVHVLVRALEGSSLQSIVRTWKSFTANSLQRTYGRKAAIWQREYFDRIVRDESELHEKAQYIINNPVKRWPETGEYPWAGFRTW
jgi:REP element-mobilizing transposase RayT